MAYPVAMDTHPTFPQELWDRTPPEVQAYIRALEARLESIEAMVHALQGHIRTLEERLNQTSRNSSTPAVERSAAVSTPKTPPGAASSWGATGPSRPDAYPQACGRGR